MAYSLPQSLTQHIRFWKRNNFLLEIFLALLLHAVRDVPKKYVFSKRLWGCAVPSRLEGGLASPAVINIPR